MGIKQDLKKIRNSEIFLVLVLAAAIYVAWLIHEILFVLFGGILLAIAFSSLISFISRRTRLSWRKSFFISLFITVVLALIFIYFLSTVLIGQFSQFINQFPKSGQEFQNQIENFFGLEMPAGLFDRLNSLILSILTLDILTTTLGFISSMILILVLVLYFSFDPGEYLNVLNRTDGMRKIIQKIGVDLRLWLVGTFYSMVVVGVLTGVGLLLLGVRFALVLGLIAGILEFIPYIGPIISWVPGLVISASQEPKMAFYVTLLYLGIHIIEGYILVPIIQKKLVSFPPAYHVISIAIFGGLFGIWGIFFAVPIVIAARAAYRAYENNGPTRNRTATFST